MVVGHEVLAWQGMWYQVLGYEVQGMWYQVLGYVVPGPGYVVPGVGRHCEVGGAGLHEMTGAVGWAAGGGGGRDRG